MCRECVCVCRMYCMTGESFSRWQRDCGGYLSNSRLFSLRAWWKSSSHFLLAMNLYLVLAQRMKKKIVFSFFGFSTFSVCVAISIKFRWRRRMMILKSAKMLSFSQLTFPNLIVDDTQTLISSVNHTLLSHRIKLTTIFMFSHPLRSRWQYVVYVWSVETLNKIKHTYEYR